MTDYWPMDTAPKDREILAWWPISHGIWVITHWDKNQFATRPRPYWSSYHLRRYGVKGQRDAQPTHWREKLAAPI